jgi:cell division protease FtsH
VVARGRGRGGATIYASSDQVMLTELDLIKQLVTTMGGAAAESFAFGMLSTGDEDDIDQATKIAHSMCAAYGMSPAIGPVAIGEKEGQVFLGRDLANMGNVAAASLELIDSEVRRMVHDADETAKRVLMLNVAVLEDLANSLLRAETLSGPSLDVYMEAVTLWPHPLIKEIAAHEPPVHLRQGADEDEGDEQQVWDDEPSQ